MEQDVDTGYRAMCSTCLSSDRNLISINGLTQVYQVFRLLMYDFAGERFGDTLSDVQQMVCWECLALLRRFIRFKQQVHSAQEHLRVLAMSQSHETLDHTYMSQSLSTLDVISKTDYDKIYFNYTTQDPSEWPAHYITIAPGDDIKDEDYDVAQAVQNNISLNMDTHILEVPEIDLDGQVTAVMSHIVVSANDLVVTDDYSQAIKGELTELASGSIPTPQIEAVIMCERQPAKVEEEEKPFTKSYVTEYMSESDMLAFRENAKQKVQYASAIYKCELCIIGFYNQQQVEDHFISAHRAKPGTAACKVCYVFVKESKLQSHQDTHYTRHTCKLCGYVESSVRLMTLHIKSHLTKQQPANVIKIGDVGPTRKSRKKKSANTAQVSSPPKPGDLRKLLSKTTIEGYQCLECDMFFKNSRARKNHVARFHREGLQCDHCKKRFVNRTTLATHLRLHEGPLPREKCPICHKMVRVIQLKYHIQRHENTSRYECRDCNKVFSHMATYQAHLKFSRAHASDHVFKFPCPMCNKGYPTKEAMQDHFNYQHLGKTSHKCPICDKPIASKANVEKHMMRVHGEKKEKPRNHTCQQCGKSFTDKKALTQHEVIHSAERPLSCDLCQQTFRQKASLYTHRKRVHKVFPPKKVVEFIKSENR